MTLHDYLSTQTHRPPFARRRSTTPALLGCIGLMLLTGQALAQEVDDEIEAAEKAAAEAGGEEPEAPASEEAKPEAEAPKEPPQPSDAAQPAPAAQPTAPVDQGAESSAAPPPADERELDEIVVTADRRRKSLQDYAGVVQAFSQEKLQNVGVTGVSGLAAMVPGLQIGQQEGNTEVYIRGVGNDNNAEHGDMGVAIHLDGVYLPRPRGVGAMFYDIERVEVASGPQGTLRGRNAQGGSLNIVSAKPQLSTYGTYAQATFGTFAERRYEGMINVPFGDTFALRAAGLSSRHDPHWVNAGPLDDLEAAQDEDAYALRMQAKWQPIAPLTVLVGGDYVHEGGTGYIGANFDGALRYTTDDGIRQPISPDEVEDPRRIYQLGHQARQNMAHQGVRAQVNFDAGAFEIEAMASYRDLLYRQVTGGSAGVIHPEFDFDDQGTDFYGGAFWRTESQSQVYELRAFAPDSARLRWTAGLFALLEDQQVVLQQNSDPVNGYAGAEFNMPDVQGNSYAAYADATFDVTPQLRVLAGLRATTETKSRFGGLGMQLGGSGNLGRYGTEGFRPRYRGRTLYSVEDARADLRPEDLPLQYRNLPDGDPAKEDARDVAARVNLFLDGVGSFGGRDEVSQSLCEPPFQAADGEEQQDALTVLDNGALRCTNGVNQAVLLAGGFNVAPVSQNAETKNFFLDWRAGVEYDLSDDSLLYATVSTAHKSAGYNDNIDTDVAFDLYYDPESVVAYEIGSKNTLLDRRMRLNASLFFYQYDDQVFQQIVQIGEVTDGGQANTTSLRQNAASSNIYGLDLDVQYALPLGLEVEAHALLLNAKYGADTIVNDGRIDFNVGRYEVDIADNWLPRASRFTLNYALSQVIFSTAGQFNWVIQGQTRTRHFMSAFNGDGNLLPEVNGRVPGGPDPDNPGATLPTSGEYNLLVEDASRLTDVVPAYTRFDLGAGWKHPDGRMQVSAYVNNVFDVAYATSIISTPNLNLRFFNPPRTAGVRVRVDW